MRKPYEQVDKTMAKARRQINAVFANAVNALPFDEINAVSQRKLSQEMYAQLIELNRHAFERIADKAYRAAYKEMGLPLPDKPDTDGIVIALLAMYHPLTSYSYNSESKRKRDRLTESILAAGTRLAIRDAYHRAAGLWDKQSQQYADLAEDEARNTAFREAGIKHVMWMTERDGKVCGTCAERDGVIYELGSVPSKPHWHCRCWLKPVKGEAKVLDGDAI